MIQIKTAEYLCIIYWFICCFEYWQISAQLNSFSSRSKINFKMISFLYFLSAVILLIHSSFLPFLIIAFVILLVFYQLDGPFNGGADYIHFITVIVLFIIKLPNSNKFITKSALLYLTFQVILSYFIAGVVKIKNQEWRNGKALIKLFTSPNFRPNVYLRKFFLNQYLALIFSWIIITFEIFSTILLFAHKQWPFFIFLGLFHFFNFINLGLNRFVFAWIITYPLIINIFDIF